MKENPNKRENFITIRNNDNIFIIFQNLSIKKEDIKDELLKIKEEKENENKSLSLIIDINNLAKDIKFDELTIIKEIITKITFGELEYSDKNDYNLNIYIKNCLFETEGNIFYEDSKLYLNQLYISDELYSLSPRLDKFFANLRPKKLTIKKIKINSKQQLENFYDFIIKNDQCEDLTLEDFFIELIIKKDDDKEYNKLNQYFFYKEGKIYINSIDDETKIKKLKLIDCPLFAIKKDTFKDINNYKDIIIDIDENSLLNPNIITKFKINDGYSDICFDLDSYKINKNIQEDSKDSNDYIQYLKYIFKIIIDNEDNNNFKKLHFRNFDITKYEYITGENLTFIDEKNWVFNNEEKERKNKFENFNEEINKKIDDNLNKLSNVKELIFDNCSNYFIQLILKLFKNNTNNNELDLLKLKKCGKEYFDLKNILSLKIKNLILFDTPLIIDHFPENNTSNLNNFKGNFGKFDNLTININTLEHYCNANNLNYFKTIEIIVELINNKNFNQNICFEMNAFPTILEFLIAKNCRKDYIPCDFNIKSNEDRQKLIEKCLLKNLTNRTITIKRNNIKNSLENYYYISKITKINKDEFGNDTFDIDTDYKTFFYINKIKEIILKDNIFTNSFESKIREDERLKTAFLNLINYNDEKNKKDFKIDIKTLNQAIYNNKFINFMELYYNYLYVLSINENIETNEQYEAINNMIYFIGHIKFVFEKMMKYVENITIIFDNLKERKEFYWLLCFWGEIKIDYNYYDKKYIFKKSPKKFLFPDKNKKLKEKFTKYIIKEANEEKKDKFCSLNYYYVSEEEKNLFSQNANEEINYEGFKFNVEYWTNKNNKFDNDNVELESKLFINMLME